MRTTTFARQLAALAPSGPGRAFTRLFLGLVFWFASPVGALYARDVGGVLGRVTDDAGRPLAEVRVEAVEARRATLTDRDGRFAIANLAAGTHTIVVSAPGFRPALRRVAVAEASIEVNVTLLPSVVEVPALQVTASAVATTALTSPQPLSVLGPEELRGGARPNLGAVLEVLPGVRNLSTGSGIGKPVIRGLTSNRVLVLVDGQRVENQQWGDEHGANVETADASRIELIRGPASVLYGSDALGGVVNVVRRPLPDALDGAGFARWTLGGAYATNAEAPEGLMAVEAASGGFGVRGSLVGRRAGDVETPGGPLFNSGYRSRGGNLAAGLRGGWGSVSVEYTGRAERVEIHEDPKEQPGFTGFQRIADDRVRAELDLPLSASSRLEVITGFGQNFRREFEAAGLPGDDFALGLRSRLWTADVQLHHVLGQWAGVAGVSGLRNTFAKSGEETLIPNSASNAIGLFLFEQREAGPWHFSLGGRYDYRRLAVQNDDALGVTAQTRDYQSVTGTLGVLYRVAEPVALVANLGRGYRSPSTFELFSNGVHEGTVRFERGTPTLRNETSFNTDLALRIQSERVRLEVGGFLNRVDGFIYPDPTGEFDPASGLRIYDITQGDATLAGFEAGAEVHPTETVHLRASADYTRGENTSRGEPLPFIPPLRLSYGVRLELSDRGTLRGPYLDLGGETNTRQSRLDPEDLGPPGYTLVHAEGGAGFALGGLDLDLTLGIRNLFDASYTNFMSRYKFYALDAGRNVIVRITSRF